MKMQDTESATKAVDALFSANPVMAAVIVGLVLAIIILWRKYDKLTTNFMELVKTNSTAVASIVPITQGIKEDNKQTLAQFAKQSEAQRDEIIRHINTIAKFSGARDD